MVSSGRRGKLWRILPLLVLPIAGWALASLTGFVPQDLLEFRQVLRDQAQAYVFIAFFVYVAAYAAAVAISVPGAIIFTLLGGFLFGAFAGGMAAVVGSGLGACLVFLLARGILRNFFEAGASGLAARLAGRFAENAFSYLLFLRLVPAFPFFLVNIVPAFCGVSLPVFAAATFLGITPAAFVFAAIGAGLDEIIAQTATEGFSMGALLAPSLVAGLAGLGLLSLLPVFWKIWARRRIGNGHG